MKISYYLPEGKFDNEQLSQMFPEWTPEKILSKTGIRSRRIVAVGETALDLADRAARKLFDEGAVSPQDVDYLLLCTQSPVYSLPSSACLLHQRLGLRANAGALAFDHGCSGYVYGLSVAKGLLAGGMARSVLLVTAETYSQYLDPTDKSTRAIFGDGAAATYLTAEDLPRLGAFAFGTDGSGADKLIVRNGRLYMNGPDIFNFTLDVVPTSVDEVLKKDGLTVEDIDLFVFHQANKFMLDTLRKVMRLPKEKFYVNLEETGNTVSSSIPIALRQLTERGALGAGNRRVLLVGFGVGLSWASTILTI